MPRSTRFAALALLLLGCASNPASLEERAQGLAQELLILDGHIDLPIRLHGKMEEVTLPTGGDFDYPRARRGGLNAPFMSIYSPASTETEGTSKAFADGLIDIVESIAEGAPDKFVIASSVSEVEQAFRQGKIALLLGMENGSPIEGDLANLEHFYRRGVRYITLCHSKDNHICDSSYDKRRSAGGLTPFGKQLIERMNQLGVLIDVSHISDDSFWQVMQLTQAPAIASHSSLRHFTPNFERNMSDAMVRRLAENGGVVQINFGSSFINADYQRADRQRREDYAAWLTGQGVEPGSEQSRGRYSEYVREHPIPFADLSDVVDHIDRVVELTGIEHVGLGSDFDGVGDSLPTGLKDVADYPNLIAELLCRGYSKDDIAKIASGNVLRVMAEAERIARPVMRKLLLSLGVFLGLTLALELGYRGYLYAAGMPHDASAVRNEMERILEPIGTFVPRDAAQKVDRKEIAGGVLHPFYASEKYPDTGRVLARFRAGFAETDYVIIVLGGSVAAAWATTMSEDFERALEQSEAFRGRNVVLLNAAHAAYKQPQQVTRLVFLLSQGFVPDAVINLDGFNEVCGGISNGLIGTHPVYPNIPVWGSVLRAYGSTSAAELECLGEMSRMKERASSWSRFTSRLRLFHSSVLSRVALSRIRRLRQRAASLEAELDLLSEKKRSGLAYQRMVYGPPYDEELENLMRITTTNWFESSRSLAALCRSRGIAYLHVLQPALHDPGSKPMSAEEKAVPPGEHGRKYGPEMAYDVLRLKGKVLETEGIAFSDATRIFAQTREHVFLDTCHLNPRGNHALRSLIQKAFLEHFSAR